MYDVRACDYRATRGRGEGRARPVVFKITLLLYYDYQLRAVGHSKKAMKPRPHDVIKSDAYAYAPRNSIPFFFDVLLVAFAR